VVHRLGIVSALDVDDTKHLKIKWQTAQFVAVEKSTGKETILDRPGILIENESAGELRFVEYEKSFVLGEHIRLSTYEIYCCIVTFFRYGIETAQLIEKFGRGLGHAINEQKAV
jgi:hypothetical protein